MSINENIDRDMSNNVNKQQLRRIYAENKMIKRSRVSCQWDFKWNYISYFKETKSKW